MKHSFKQNSSLNSNRKRSQTILIGIVSFLVLTFLEVFLLSPDSAFCHPEAHAGVGGISTGKAGLLPCSKTGSCL